MFVVVKSAAWKLNTVGFKWEYIKIHSNLIAAIEIRDPTALSS